MLRQSEFRSVWRGYGKSFRGPGESLKARKPISESGQKEKLRRELKEILPPKSS